MHLLYFDEANLAGQLAKTVMLDLMPSSGRPQLLSGANGLDLHPSFLNALSDAVISRVDMFAAIMEDGTLTELNGGLVVDLHSNCARFLSLSSARRGGGSTTSTLFNSIRI